MGQEEWPRVPISEIGCLRLNWPKELFSFVGRYQLELEQMRKECRDQYSKVTSGTCPTCEKFIHVNLGKHVALYHLDLAQLWRCPVGWCPVWKGTSQDCVDHMRRAHDTGLSVKAGTWPAFLEEADSESIRRSHRRRVKEIAAGMSGKPKGKTSGATDTMPPETETQ